MQDRAREPSNARRGMLRLVGVATFSAFIAGGVGAVAPMLIPTWIAGVVVVVTAVIGLGFVGRMAMRDVWRPRANRRGVEAAIERAFPFEQDVDRWYRAPLGGRLVEVKVGDGGRTFVRVSLDESPIPPGLVVLSTSGWTSDDKARARANGWAAPIGDPTFDRWFAAIGEEPARFLPANAARIAAAVGTPADRGLGFDNHQLWVGAGIATPAGVIAHGYDSPEAAIARIRRALSVAKALESALANETPTPRPPV